MTPLYAVEPYERITLSAAQRQRMVSRAMRELLSLVVAQTLALSAVALLALIFGGQWAMLSALAGGMSYLGPTSIFVLHMVLKLMAQRDATPTTFFVGEAIKIGVSMVLMFLSVKVLGVHMHWLAFMAGLLIVLKAYIFLLMFRQL